MRKSELSGTISLKAALDIIWYTNDSFSLRFVSTKGERKDKPRVRGGGKTMELPTEKSDNGREYHNIKSNGLLMLTNLETMKAFNVKISLITHINDRQIIHWYHGEETK